ncbi:hypothetical protein GE061_007148 [Apolygus lucorum]|uniref:RING-type domain-containing protein n=1 Tax=Apolygus lucorum TaxID=248454 RepID=A0A8S9WR56_APOLU|nr:hypothetical protein GE061_007148 [Apolygus lucorum]
MSAVASPSAAPTPSRSTLKRRHDSSSDDDVCAKQRYFYVLAPESSDYSSDGPESIYSVQAKSTDVARDTSDTSSKDSWSGSDDSRMFELEVVSISESERAFPFSVTTSSSPEDMERVPSLDSEMEPTGAGSSRRSAESDEEGEDRIRFAGLFAFCRQCKGINTDPHFMYCIRCHRLRKSFLPERPKGKRVKSKNQLKDSSRDEDAHDSGIHSQSSTGTLPLDQTPPLGTQESPSQVCQICMVNPRDGGFCHDNIVHVYSCYRCSIKTFKQRGRCPVCNRRPRHVSKVITV